jgi:3-oxoacyl-[acyl-carrier protein] reductase
MSLQNKIAFVSDGSRPLGNGRGIALALARKGADVAVSGWNHMEGAISVAEEIKTMGRRSMAVKMDASNYLDVQKGFAAIKDELGPVSILVNNAALMNMLGGLDLFVF